MNKKIEDVFSDLEKDIEGDWKDIQAKITREESKEKKEENIKNPKRPFFPSFDEFYAVLTELAYGNVNNQKWSYELQFLIRTFIHSTGQSMPKSLKTIWEALCDPQKVDYQTMKCSRCNIYYDVTYRNTYDPQMINRIEEDMSRIPIDPYMRQEMHIRKRRTVHCPSCGMVFMILNDADLISISLTPEDSTEDDNNRRERRYDIKRDF